MAATRSALPVSTRSIEQRRNSQICAHAGIRRQELTPKPLLPPTLEQPRPHHIVSPGQISFRRLKGVNLGCLRSRLTQSLRARLGRVYGGFGCRLHVLV